MQWILIFVGGGLGSLVRYSLSKYIIITKYPFPVSTLISNVVACIILGITAAWVGNKALSNNYYLLLGTGFCGGFSTFSTFSYETLKLWQQGDFAWAIANILISIFGCLAAVYFGLKLVR